jgi:N utilization substance protein A
MEDYDTLAKFVDLMEKGLYAERQEVIAAREKVVQEALQTIPKPAFNVALNEEILPQSVLTILGESGIQNLGDLALEYKTNPDSILGLPGIGPKTLKKIEEVVKDLSQFIPTEPEPAPIEADLTEEIVEPAVEQVVPEMVASEAVVEIPESISELEEAGAETTAESQAEKPKDNELSFEEMFKIETQKISGKSFEDEEVDESSDKDDKKKKKRKFQEIEYDPDRDLTLVKKKHKRGDGDWGLEDES